VAERKDHREALLEGAIQCLQEKGYARTTARDIVAAAGSHLPSINYYFGSKEALLNAAIAESARRWMARVEELTAGGSPKNAWEWLQALGADMFDVFEESRPIIAAFFEALAEAQRSEELRLQLAGYEREFRQGLARLAEEALPPGAAERGVDPELVAAFLMALADGLMIQWLLEPERTPGPDQLLRALGGLASLPAE
jgi:AcrR family transcriptional regulator